MRIVVQIVNYNTKHYLTDCITSILSDIHDLGSKYEVIISVLDNNSHDDLSDIINHFGYKVLWHKSDVNLGFGGGHNVLASKYDSDILILVNPDSLITQKNTISRLIYILNSSDHIGIVGPKLISKKYRNYFGDESFGDQGNVFPLYNDFIRRLGISNSFHPSNTSHVNRVCGAFLLIKKDVFDILGGFDEGFFLYHEDVDICLRANQIDKYVYYVPEVQVQHRGGFNIRRLHYFLHSRGYFIKKHFIKYYIDHIF